MIVHVCILRRPSAQRRGVITSQTSEFRSSEAEEHLLTAYNSSSRKEVFQYVNGQPFVGSSDDFFATVNPATNDTIAEVQSATENDVDVAVASCHEGFKVWSKMTAKERSVILFRAAQLLRERNEELAQLEVEDTGKPICEAIAVDILSGADVIEYYAGLVVAMQGEQQELSGSKFFYTRREPLGVCAGEKR